MTVSMSNPTAAQVARVLVELAANDSDDNQEPMSPMRLHKLLYYVQGWSLARRGQKAFNDQIQAWNYGPVVPSIYARLRDLGRSPIPPSQLDDGGVSEELRAFIASVWCDLREYSAIELGNLTHQEKPWVSAWSKRSQTNRCTEEITEASLREYFAARTPSLPPNLKPQAPDPSWFDEPSPFCKA